MSACKRCGAEYAQHAAFCRYCGNDLLSAELPADIAKPADTIAFCASCGAHMPNPAADCPICGALSGEAAEPIATTALTSFAPANRVAIVKSNAHLIAAAICISLTMIIGTAALWAITAYQNSANSMRAQNAILYFKADNALYFQSPTQPAPEQICQPLKVEALSPNMAKASENGRYIAYLDEYSQSAGKLLIKDLSKESAPVELVAENVRDFYFTPDSSKLLYKSKSGELYVSDFLQSIRLDDDILAVLDYNDSRVLYTKAGKNQTVRVYCTGLIPDSTSFMVDENILRLADYTPSFERFVYLRSDDDGAQNVVACDLKLNSRQVLAIGVDALIAADAQSFTALYQVAAVNPLRFENLITDDLAARDKRIAEPQLEDYPLLAEFYEINGIDSDYSESMDREELAEESDAFQQAQDTYDQKRERDKQRAAIRAEIEAFVQEHPKLYSLHLYQNASTTRLCENSFGAFDSATLDIQKGFVVWPHMDWLKLQKTRFSKIAQLLEKESVTDYLNAQMDESINFIQFGHKAVRLHTPDAYNYAVDWQLTEKANGIYVILGSSSPLVRGTASALYYCPIQNGTAGELVMIDEEVQDLGPALSGANLLYFKDLLDGLGDLYYYNGASSVRIGKDVTPQTDRLSVENGKTVLYYEHFNAATETGDLFLFSKETRQLATEASRFYYSSDSLVYFLKKRANGRSDLYAFGSGGLALIDSDVILMMDKK